MGRQFRHRGRKYGSTGGGGDDAEPHHSFYVGHDNRQVHLNPRGGGSRGGISGRIKFKQGRHRSQTLAVPSGVLRDDVDMDGARARPASLPQGRGGIRGRMGRRGGRSQTFPGDRAPENSNQWFKIDVIGGKSFDKTLLLRSFASAVQLPFCPYHYEVSERTDGCSFYVEGTGLLRELKNARDRIIMPDGRRSNWKYMATVPPQTTLDDSIKLAILNDMGARYVPENKALDLSAFDQRDVFKNEGLFVSLSRANVAEAVVKIIKEHIPETSALDLSKNKFLSAKTLVMFKTTLPGLRILYYKHNGLRNLLNFKPIEGWKLEEINLEGNPVCQAEGSAGYDAYLRYCVEFLLLFE